MILSIVVLFLLTSVLAESPDVKGWKPSLPPPPTRYPSFTATQSSKPSASSSPSLKKKYSIAYINFDSTRTINVRILQKISTYTSTPSYTRTLSYTRTPSYTRTRTKTPSVQTQSRMLRQDPIEEKETQSVSTLFLSILLPTLSAMCIVLVYMCANSKKSYVCLLSRGYSPCILRFFKKRGLVRTQILPTVESSGLSQATTYSQHSMKQRHSHESFDSPA